MMNELISDYLKITGRPAATLSVDEFIKFIQISHTIDDTSKITTPTVNAEKVESINTGNKPYINKNTAKETETKTSNITGFSALEMLKSVNG